MTAKGKGRKTRIYWKDPPPACTPGVTCLYCAYPDCIYTGPETWQEARILKQCGIWDKKQVIY